MSLEAAHEEIWTLFEGGYFKLAGTDDNVGIVPCHSHDERRIAAEQKQAAGGLPPERHQGWAAYRNADEPVERRSAAS